MTYLDAQAPVHKVAPALFAGAALFLASAMSISGLNVLGMRFGFGFLPILVLAIWPRQANTLLSLGFVFFAGLFADWAIGGILGQSALIFVLIWGLLRPELRDAPFAPFRLFLMWLAICGLALLVLTLTGYFVHGVFPDLASPGRQMILATFILPLALILRRLLAKRFTDSDDWG